jgi:hypothetical protein
MKKIAPLLFIFLSLICFSQTSDSLQHYKTRTSELSYRQDSLLQKVTAAELELKDQEKFYLNRIDKLQTLLIGAVASSVLVIGLAFYMLNKKKAQEKK